MPVIVEHIIFGVVVAAVVVADIVVLLLLCYLLNPLTVGKTDAIAMCKTA